MQVCPTLLGSVLGRRLWTKGYDGSRRSVLSTTSVVLLYYCASEGLNNQKNNNYEPLVSLIGSGPILNHRYFVPRHVYSVHIVHIVNSATVIARRSDKDCCLYLMLYKTVLERIHVRASYHLGESANM